MTQVEQGGDLASIREGFDAWSAAMPAVITSFGLPAQAGRVYRLHCPMAFEGRGAVWLQADEQVKNPYFGASMLTCADDVAPLWEGSGDRIRSPRFA